MTRPADWSHPASPLGAKCVMRYDGKHLVVIGGSSGFGLAAARLTLAEGGSVTLAGRSAERLDRAAQGLGESGRVRTAVADVASEAEIAALFAAEVRVDSLFVTAGSPPTAADLLTTDLTALRSILETRIMGLAFVLRAARGKLAPDASIILTSGQYATRPGPGAALAAGAVGAVEAMTRALALDLAPIRVNAIAPRLIETELWDSHGPGLRARNEAQARGLPLGRAGRPEEVAEAALLLMTNGFITGTVLRLDGGGILA